MAIRNRRIIVLIFVLVLVFSPALYIYLKQDTLVSKFKRNLEELFSEVTNSEVSISKISGNVFTRIVFKDLNFKFKEYNLNFKKCELEYSLLDILSGKESINRDSDITLTLKEGLLRHISKLVVLDDIAGHVVLKQDSILLDSLDFNLFGIFDNKLKGEILTNATPLNVKLSLQMRPFFEKDKAIFKIANFDIDGAINNISVYGQIEKDSINKVLFSSYLISEENTHNIGARVSYRSNSDADPVLVAMDSEVDIKAHTIDSVIRPKEGKILIGIDYSDWPLLKSTVSNQHLNIHGSDFTNIIESDSRIAFKDNRFSHVRVDGFTESSILNYTPIDESEFSMLFDGAIMRLVYLKMGNTLAASGTFNMQPPRRTSIKVTFSDFDIARPFKIINQTDDVGVSGLLSGDISIDGDIELLKSDIALVASDGILDNVEYRKMIINAKSSGHDLIVDDSRIIREDSYLTLKGAADLREFSNEKFMEDIVISTDDKTIIWEGWDITKVDKEGEFSLHKGLEKGVRVGYTTYLEDETQYGVNQQDEIGLEYDLMDDKGTLELKAKEGEEFLGVKKKYKF